MSILQEICDRKRGHVLRMKQKCTQSDLIELTPSDLPRFIFEKNLQEQKNNQKPAIIAEVKKASPSKGIIRSDFNPIEIAKNYQAAGATCISCLTDTPYFHGQDKYLVDIKREVSLPVLRKDFMIDLYQIYESRMLGADAILIIMAALEDSLAKDMFELATELGMSALFEVHNQEELDRALKLSPKIIGVNNRNLKNLDVSLKTSENLIPQIPENIIRISESGISSDQEIKNLHKKGFDCFLIGESLMNKKDEKSTLSALLNS